MMSKTDADKKKKPKRPAGVELQDDPGPLSMYPLDVGKALEAALKVKPPPKLRRPGRKKKESPAEPSRKRSPLPYDEIEENALLRGLSRVRQERLKKEKEQPPK
jgi:hypothetical protein